MTFEPGRDERIRHIAALLLANRAGSADWGDLSYLHGEPCTQRIANKFLVCCLLDYQIDSDVAWRNGNRLVEDVLGNPDDVWSAIASSSESEWVMRRDEYRLHRFPAAHRRLWRIAKCICDKYDGDARCIWAGKESLEVLKRLLALGAGKQISRMIVGALRDCGQIQGASDVKADVYVCRVLGRAVTGKVIDANTAADLARQLHSADPWQLDWPLWNVGRFYCHADHPNCLRCDLVSVCAYALDLPATEPSSTTERVEVSSETKIGQISYEQAKAKFAQALSVTTYNSASPRFLYFEVEEGKYEKVHFAAYASWIERSPNQTRYPEWCLRDAAHDTWPDPK
jgi:endonuclease III